MALIEAILIQSPCTSDFANTKGMLDVSILSMGIFVKPLYINIEFSDGAFFTNSRSLWFAIRELGIY
jgi:hypothetical protein